MNVSGIVVTTAPARVPEVAESLAAFPFLEVTCTDAAGGRIVVVQERENVSDEMEGLRAIRRVPGVIAADLVVHYFGDENPPPGLTVADVARRLEHAGAGERPAPVTDSKPNSWRNS